MTLVFTPHLVRSVILTGHLIYPLKLPVNFRLDWRVPSRDVDVVRNYIAEFAVLGDRLHADLKSLSVAQKVAEWLRTWSGSSKGVLVLLITISGLTVLLTCGLLFPRVVAQVAAPYAYPVLLSCASTVYCFVAAPEPRFLGVWLISSVSLLMAITLYAIRSLWQPPALVTKKLLLLCVSCFVIMSSNWLHIVARNIFHSIAPAPLPQVLRSSAPQLQASDGGAQSTLPLTNLLTRIYRRLFVLPLPPTAQCVFETNQNGLRVLVPAVGNRLWYSPLPSTQRLHPHLMMRGSNLADGFRVTGPSLWKCLITDHDDGMSRHIH